MKPARAVRIDHPAFTSASGNPSVADADHAQPDSP